MISKNNIRIIWLVTCFEITGAKEQSVVDTSPRKLHPVSVIVSEKSRSVSNSSVPSPTSSVAESNNSLDDRESIQNAKYDNSKHDGDDNMKNAGNQMENYGDLDHDGMLMKKHKAEYNYKPLPMSRKSRRQFKADDQKDNHYWERRRRNNEAAKKSREQRREKEIEVNRKCVDLEKENSDLRFTIINLQERNTKLTTTMHMYKEILIKNNLI